MAYQIVNIFRNWSNLTKLQRYLIIAIICLAITLLILIFLTVFLLIRTDIRIRKCNKMRRMPITFRQMKQSRSVTYKDIVNDTSTTKEEEFVQITHFIVSLHYKLSNGTDVAYCVGSILTQKYFITSSICIHKKLITANLYVRAGSVYYDKGGTIHRFTDTILIPDWRSNYTDYYTYRYIALVKVEDKFLVDRTEISTVILPKQERERFLPNYKLYTAGWGTYVSMKVKPMYKKLRIMPVQMYDASTACRGYFQEDEILALLIVENVLCGGDLKAPSKDQCNIDAGAPLTHLGIITGVSWSGMSCKNYPTVYTKKKATNLHVVEEIFNLTSKLSCVIYIFIMTTVLKIYNRLLQRYPIITSSVQTGILMATGDVIAQTFVEKKSLTKINLVRTAQFGSMGIFFAGPGLTTWYRILAARFGSSSLTLSAVLKKVASDQLIFAPIFIGVFLAALGVIQGQTYEGIQREIKRNYTDILISNYKLWPWVQLGNFYVTPVRYQILVVQVVAIFWNTYLSWKTQSVTENFESN